MTLPEARETAGNIARAVAASERSAVQIIHDYLQRIEHVNESLNCFCEVYNKQALAQAQDIDRRVAAGESVGPLAGVPVAVKDNIVTTSGRTTCGSRLLENYRSPFNATVIERLVDAGAIIIGKTNLDEFGMGSSTEHSAFGATRNPWATNHVPGGSSGGSAAAVAAGLSPVALGSDTGGSIRQPAGFCGVVGVKPTYGRVSRYGLVAFGSSLDQIGPITHTVDDAALLLQCMAGVDSNDSTSVDRAINPMTENLTLPVENLRVGVPKQFLTDDNGPEVNTTVESAIQRFREIGAEIVDIELPLTEYGLATYYVIAPAEASSNLARFDGIRYGRREGISNDESLYDLYARSRAEGFSTEVQRRIMLGTFALSAGYHDQYYKRALCVRRLIKQEYDAAFESCDVILGPVSPSPAFRAGETNDPMTMYRNDMYTVNANIAGICAASIPAGFAERAEQPLPVGIHLQCPDFEEGRLLRIARQFQEATDINTLAPIAHAERPTV